MSKRLPWVVAATAAVSAGVTYWSCCPPGTLAEWRRGIHRAFLRRPPPLTLDFDANPVPDHAAPSSPTTPPPIGFLGGVELGGTTCVAAVSSTEDPTTFIARDEFPTESPDQTFPKLAAFLNKYELAAVGIASFGPVDLDKDSPTYGHITTTTKLAFINTDVVGYFKAALAPNLLISFDTDVNAPAMAELEYGDHGRNVQSCAYITVGTGVGVGAVINGAPVHGLTHMEGGHITPPRKREDTFPGTCSFHRHCVEGMVAAGAITARTGFRNLTEIPDEDPVWDCVAFYLANLCSAVTYLLSPHVIVLSGGIMQRRVLFQKIRVALTKILRGYGLPGIIASRPELYIKESQFGNTAGIIGALELARRALYRLEG